MIYENFLKTKDYHIEATGKPAPKMKKEQP